MKNILIVLISGLFLISCQQSSTKITPIPSEKANKYQ